MINDNKSNVLRGGFVASGAVSVSTAAMGALRAAAKELPPDKIVLIGWAFERRMRLKGTNDWRDLGAGNFLSDCRRAEVPGEAIFHAGKLDFAVRIPDEKLRLSRQHVIDVEPGAPQFFTLR